jgi:hypothetical protein
MSVWRSKIGSQVLINALTVYVDFRRFDFSDYALIKHVDPAATLARLIYTFVTMAFWIVLAGHGAGDISASGKRLAPGFRGGWSVPLGANE